MVREEKSYHNMTTPNSESNKNYKRKLNPSDILLPLGYNIDVFAEGLRYSYKYGFYRERRNAGS